MTTAGEPLGTADRRGPAIGDDAARDAVARARAEELALVRFLYVDHGGIVRGKAVSADRLPERMVSGIGHTVAMMAMSMLDDLRPADGMGPVGEVRIVPDPATFVSLPYAPGAGAMLADLVRPDGQPWDACARTFLKQAIAALAADGYGLNAAFEPEFTLGRRQASPDGGPDRLVPVDDSLCYSATGSHLAHDYTMELFGRAAGTGLAGGALLSRTRPRPAGDVDRPRAGPAGGRQPRAVPGERAWHRLPPRAVG